MLKGKNALITGAARGIGKEIAMALAKEGVNIIINDIEAMREEAQKTANEVSSLGVNAEFFPGDVSNFNSTKEMAAKIQEKHKKIDILVNNAGITKDRTLKKMVPEEWNPVININLTGMYNVTHNILPIIPEGGRIINISSIVGIGGNFGQCNYAASKGGVMSTPELEHNKYYYWLLLIELPLIVYVGIKRLFFLLWSRKPKYNSWWYDRLPACKDIRSTAERGQTALALNVVYNYFNDHQENLPKTFSLWLELQRVRTWGAAKGPNT